MTTDLQLLQRLADNTVGSNTDSMKEDFIVAHFRTPCSICAGYCNGVRISLLAASSCRRTFAFTARSQYAAQ